MAHDDEDDQGERLINEGTSSLQAKPSLTHLLTPIAEYKTWKKNSPFLYDMILG